MKKLLMLIALVVFPALALTGCAKSGGIVEPAAESDGSMNAEQRQQYEEQMTSGAGGSNRPGN